MRVKIAVKGRGGAHRDDDLNSVAGSDIEDPEMLKEMLFRMNQDGADSRAAARYC